MSNGKKTGCLGYTGDDTTQLYGSYNKPPSKDPHKKQPVNFVMESEAVTLPGVFVDRGEVYSRYKLELYKFPLR